MRNTRVSYSFGEVNTYIQETQLPNTGNDPVKYSLDFVPISGGGGSSPITDYVPKSIGGTFDSLIGYTTDLTASVINNNHIPNKKYVDDTIVAALGGSIIDYSLARPYFSSSAGTPLTYVSATGIFTLNKNLSQYINDAGFLTDYTVTQSDVTAHQASLTIYSSQIPDLNSGLSTSFNTLFDARIATKSIADLGNRPHSALTIAGSSEGYHISQNVYNSVNRYASGTQDGLLSSTDWSRFNSFTTGSESLFELVGEAPNQYVRCNYAFASVDNITAYSAEGYTPETIWDSLPVASASTLGVVKIGAGIDISGDGTISVSISGGNNSGNSSGYTIRLNSGSTVTQRLSGLVVGVDYPTGWTLAADNAALVITHGLNSIATVVKVFSKNGITSDLVELQGNVAYATFTNKYSTGYNIIRLDALATVATELYLKIII